MFCNFRDASPFVISPMVTKCRSIPTCNKYDLVLHVIKLSSPFLNNKGAYQSAKPSSLITILFICSLDGIISKLEISELSIFWLHEFLGT